MDFKNKVVIVTGASSGIGAASAVLFAKHGAKLTLIGRHEQRLEAVAKKCQEANGITPLCLRLDLTAAGSCAAVITRTIATYDRIDVLVNCAAKMLIGSLFDDNIDTFDEMIDINLQLATEGVRVNAVQPGLTRTNILANLAMGEDEMEHTYEHLSNKMKILDPEEVAKMVVFVASEVCPNLNGSDIGLTGASWMI
ncbi:hypothetical protein HW555_010947 [Spodoptera exigua]|uniref:Uncharacterized protein n=1 Tax=Spodoptera exigua TaxID=7107 RepID=A0A835L125_SPOEX|nr:hypothetical protein HW555_010947 [Spodoptera exigua]